MPDTLKNFLINLFLHCRVDNGCPHGKYFYVFHSFLYFCILVLSMGANTGILFIISLAIAQRVSNRKNFLINISSVKSSAFELFKIFFHSIHLLCLYFCIADRTMGVLSGKSFLKFYQPRVFTI